ncbi:phosphoenolpyruvate carboxylase [Methanohalobium evestigatum Z-7303]|uniref:Phosphoenolpyruvate carboxylase n=1 Tax=Methanohalobium evestigatum (strain ATCC BAA-1072 / DSM 3721 / NBRC 107634 / OCM 161 / Z-7303) TaxID=644295 RepID=D7E7Q5_METEZ|nr:phosphoenolpyruvate carboxylase [Methanohalobium evestigatum]ADI74128.1 phosphoenolpyruvate carboxylase [Methanohalobium evestigatum Z-7303]
MQKDGKFPKVMCTQHPDSVSKYISTKEEINEALEAVVKFGCDEYMPDYEGKTTPYHQNVQIVSKFIDETDIIPGKDVFITPRATSALHENRFRQLMVMMSIAEANYNAYQYSKSQAITEFVHPMTSNIQEIVAAQQHMQDVSELAKKEFNFKMETPRIIPLLEDVQGLLNAGKIINELIKANQDLLDIDENRYRVFIGKSDSALSFGHVASNLSCKYAISELNQLGMDTGTDIGIILGAGSLPFRGHMSLKNADNFFEEYRGIDTITLQSALRYNHAESDAEKLVNIAKSELSKTARIFNSSEKEEIINIIGIFGARYNKSIQQISSSINRIADLLPPQRDRLVRGGGTGYARDVPDITGVSCACRSDIKKELEDSMPKESMELPRAIKFTGALYSMGIPPEIIGTGTALEKVREKMGEDVHDRLLSEYFPSLKSDLEFAFDYLDLDAASRFLPAPLMEDIQKDVKILSETFGLEKKCNPSYKMLLDMLQPHMLDAKYTGDLMDEEISQLVRSTLIQMAKMRKALG